MIKIRYLLMIFLSIVFISLNAVGSTEDSYSFNNENFDEFTSKYGDWQLNNDFNSFNLQGKSIDLQGLSKEVNSFSIEVGVRNFLDENENLLKIKEQDLETSRIVNFSDEWNVKFEQEYNGVKVYNSKVIVNKPQLLFMLPSLHKGHLRGQFIHVFFNSYFFCHN